MNLHKQLLTKNDCYQAGRTITPTGVMVHSTGANNPWVCRYVPGNDVLGYNTGGNHWDRPGLSKCVHAFVGKLADGTVGTVQTLPWNRRGWHAGGAANNTHIGFEICEDGLEDNAYFETVFREAVQLTAMLCRAYRLDPQKDGAVLCHSEGFRRGIASNHGDVMHWFTRHGKTMDDFRAAVTRELKGDKEVTYQEWKSYMEQYRRELAGQSATMPELLAEAVAMGLTDGARPRDLVTREECAVMARAAGSR